MIKRVRLKIAAAILRFFLDLLFTLSWFAGAVGVPEGRLLSAVLCSFFFSGEVSVDFDLISAGGVKDGRGDEGGEGGGSIVQDRSQGWKMTRSSEARAVSGASIRRSKSFASAFKILLALHPTYLRGPASQKKFSRFCAYLQTDGTAYENRHAAS